MKVVAELVEHVGSGVAEQEAKNRPRCVLAMKVLAAVLIALLAFTQRVGGQFDGIIHNIAKSTLCENQYNGCEDSFERRTHAAAEVRDDDVHATGPAGKRRLKLCF
ncbi:hypothetical protein C7M84_024846 [Penaeus vannamei]|uniref:Uncharacterized protein n=1 Tax=Penaeus vannamei TaxID=6689 RepID=A0A423TZX5_PENVA|nr:hypothetical protein C7M84_024846 [Penaeus vannamei]